MDVNLKAVLNLIWFAVAVLACISPLLLALILKRLFASVVFLKYVGYFAVAVSFMVACYIVRSLLIPIEDKSIAYEVIGIVGASVCLVTAALVVDSLLLRSGGGKDVHRTEP